MKRLITWTLAAVILMVVGGGLYANGPSILSRLLGFVNPSQAQTVESYGPIILHALQLQEKLATAVRDTSQQMTITKVHGLFGRCEEEINYLAYYQVTAGVDLETITIANISEETDGAAKIFYITLPHAEILNVELSTEHSRIVAENYPRWQPGCERNTAALVTQAQQQLRDVAEAVALEQGFLADAEEQARTTLQGILGSAGIDDVQIRFGAVEEAEEVGGISGIQFLRSFECGVKSFLMQSGQTTC